MPHASPVTPQLSDGSPSRPSPREVSVFSRSARGGVTTGNACKCYPGNHWVGIVSRNPSRNHRSNRHRSNRTSRGSRGRAVCRPILPQLCAVRPPMSVRCALCDLCADAPCRICCSARRRDCGTCTRHTPCRTPCAEEGAHSTTRQGHSSCSYLWRGSGYTRRGRGPSACPRASCPCPARDDRAACSKQRVPSPRLALVSRCNAH